MPLGTQSLPRRSDRIFVRLPVTLLVDSDQERVAQDAFTVDLSQLGVRVRTDLSLAPGQSVDVFPNRGLKHPIPSRVIWVGEHGAPQHGEAGLEFLRPLGGGNA
jgi:hypothetical protein